MGKEVPSVATQKMVDDSFTPMDTGKLATIEACKVEIKNLAVYLSQNVPDGGFLVAALQSLKNVASQVERAVLAGA